LDTGFCGATYSSSPFPEGKRVRKRRKVA